MPERLVELMAEGAALEEVAAHLGVTRRTLFDWADEKSPRYRKRMGEAMELGQALSVGYWSKIARLAGSGVLDVRTGNLVFNLKNRLGWQDRVAFTNDAPMRVELVSFAEAAPLDDTPPPGADE